MCGVFDLIDDEDTSIDRVRPHHNMDGLLVISWRHVLQARSKLKLGRAVGTDGLNADVVQRMSMRGSLLLWCTQRHGKGEHFSQDGDPLSRNMSSEGPCNAESSATQGGSLAPGVPRCDVRERKFQRLLETHSPGQHSQSHPILAAVLLRVVPRTPMRTT